ncbi:MAG: hypothetical protein IT356_01245 [Gemmatimonadaceae bacterium]|nr:hypothetical protein [Gemmatimonadaceae bacterium]
MRSIAALALAAMWAAEGLQIVTGWRLMSQAGALAFFAYFTVALLLSRPAQRGVIAVVSLLAVAAAARYSVPETLERGIGSAVLFAAFLSAMQMLRVALETSPLAERMRDRFMALPQPEQHDAMTLRTHLVSSVLGAGGLATVVPLVDAGRSPDIRRGLAESALRGVGLAVLWSPFFVAMAVSTRLARDTSLVAAVGSGLAMALAGLALSHALYGGRLRASWLLPLRRTIVESAALAAAIVMANRLWGIGNLEAVALGIPIIAAAIAWREMRSDPARLGRRWLSSLEAISVEALVVGSAMVLGEVAKELLARGVVAIPSGIAAWPTPLLIALPPVLMLGTSLLGLHPIISASCLLPLLASVERLHSLAATGSVLLGWMLCVVLSTFVVPVMYAATLFDVRQGELARGRNLRFCAVFAPIALAYLWALDWALGAF